MSFVGYCCAREAVGNAEAVAAEIEPCRKRRRFIFSSSSRPAGTLDATPPIAARARRSGNRMSPFGLKLHIVEVSNSNPLQARGPMSGYGTFRIWRDVRVESVFRGRASRTSGQSGQLLIDTVEKVA